MTQLPPHNRASAPVMLVIGDIGRWEAKGRMLPALDNCYFVSPDELSASLLQDVRPDFVISSLMNDGLDAIEISQRLRNLGYEGVYRTIVESLPNAEAVRAEIRAVAPLLDFDIYVLDGSEADVA